MNDARNDARQDAYTRATEAILAQLQAGTAPWRQPWPNAQRPANLISSRPYSGINTWLLGCQRYQDHRWLTYKQAEERGGHVRKGEKSSIAVFTTDFIPKATREDPKYQELTAQGMACPNAIRRCLKLYHVFNLSQCEDVKADPLPELHANPGQAIASAEAILSPWFAVLNVETKAHAAYSPLQDALRMPAITSFDSEESYYLTAFHELAHATGHPNRLNRFTPGEQPTLAQHGKEELIAELAACLVCSSIGLNMVQPSAEYLAEWIRTLKADSRAIVSAASQAEKAAEYIITYGGHLH